MDLVTRKKWDAASAKYDFVNSRGPEKRWADYKRDFFAPMKGKILFVAAGTGLDFRFFPANENVIAIDISPKMIEKARPRAEQYEGRIELHEMDVHELSFADDTFDQIFTVCTFCSVPDPVNGLRQLRRVLKPGGELHMFEHTTSRWFPFNAILNLMTPITRRLGPELNRDTVRNVEEAGLTIRRVRNLYLDVVKTILAVK